MIRLVGAALVVGGVLASSIVIGLLPALNRGGRAAAAQGGLPYAFNSETHLILLLDAHDLRLAALVAAGVGVAMLVASVPRVAARPAPVLVAVAVALAVANLAWGLAGVEGPVAVLVIAVSILGLAGAAAFGAARQWPAAVIIEPGPDGPSSRLLLVVPAVLAAGMVPALSLQAAPAPELAGFVPELHVGVLLAVRVLLVVAAVAAACAVGSRRFAPGRFGLRVGAGATVAAVLLVLVALGRGPALFGGLPELLLGGAFGAAVLGLAWTGDPGGSRLLQVAGGVAALVLPLATAVVVPLGVLVGVVTLVLSGAELGADGVPAAGVGLVLGAVMLLIDRCTRPFAERDRAAADSPAAEARPSGR